MKQLPLPKGKAVQLYWVDSAIKHGWQHLNQDNYGVETVSSMGYVVESKPEHLTLTCSISASDGVIAPLSIPWEAIVDIQLLPDEWDSEKTP